MLENFRYFEVTDPFGQTWQVKFLWQQNAISIRHADSVDVKFLLIGNGERQEKAIALPHPHLLALSRSAGRPMTDAWVSRLAALHLRHMIETWEDMEKALISPTQQDLEHYDGMLRSEASASR